MINVAEQKTSRARAQTQSPLPETSPPSSTLLDGVSINFPAAKAESFFHLYLLHQVHSRSTSREHPAQSLADKRHSTNVSDPGSPPVPLNFLLPPPSSAHTLPSLIPLPLVERRCLRRSCDGDKQGAGHKRAGVQERGAGVMVGAGLGQQCSEPDPGLQVMPLGKSLSCYCFTCLKKPM